jgi:hypothetical protein
MAFLILRALILKSMRWVGVVLLQMTQSFPALNVAKVGSRVKKRERF